MKGKIMKPYPVLLLLSGCLMIFSCGSSDDEIILTGMLTGINSEVPECGTIHFGSLAEYNNLNILRGTYTAEKIYVVHGCLKLEREQYDRSSGTLKQFNIGDIHRLVVSEENVYEIEVVLHGPVDPGSNPVYYCKQVDNLKQDE